MAVTNDIKPDITDVLFENVGDKFVAKIRGNSMWFVHDVSIKDVRSGDEKTLNADVSKSTECEVEAEIQEERFSYGEKVSVRVKTHFHNSKYLESKTVSARENVCIYCFLLMNILCLIQQSRISLFFLHKIIFNCMNNKFIHQPIYSTYFTTLRY